ncbi:inward rectifier potassium channel [Neolewinella xylanilytica]|uniref:Inward rectifier potassium channel n=1 Tax=Neolewinella xylanilytica TaxID=1514080 RepID=A0A2S6I348_9BACT|nr:ion channel [Neolewinella xylanilytica]PPK85580.1 inward rectifier potassium channel [Neolewinella xylanilytica]
MKFSNLRQRFGRGIETTAEREEEDLGLGNKIARKPGTRLINPDGTFNVIRRGRSVFAPYQNLVEMSWPRFIILNLLAYTACNLLFALGFYLIGTDHLNGVRGGLTNWGKFLECFYFSIQTFTTVGYGAIAPISAASNTLAALLALLGWVSLALVTGLFFARFSRPTRMVIFSERAIYAPYRNGLPSLQFRIANKRDTNLINLTARVVLTWLEDGDGDLKRHFHPLSLERDFVSLFPLNWTIVHPIDPASPMHGWTKADYCQRFSELLVTIEGYDRTFAQQITIHKSYTYGEMEWNVRFGPMYHEREATTELYLSRISATVAVGEEE